ncbi:MAG: hypothetical protein ACKOCN_01235 [Planctomycetaceae bacterium]
MHAEDEVRPLSAEESALLEWLEQDNGHRETAPSLPAVSERPGERVPAEDAESLTRAWNLLDVLPRHRSQPNLTSTTLEMVAVSADEGQPGSRSRGIGSFSRITAAALAILVSIAAGYSTGLATRGDSEETILAMVPVAMHLDVLREAGSVQFLEAFAARELPRMRRFASGEAPDDDQRNGLPDSPGGPASSGPERRIDRLLDRGSAGGMAPRAPDGFRMPGREGMGFGFNRPYVELLKAVDAFRAAGFGAAAVEAEGSSGEQPPIEEKRPRVKPEDRAEPGDGDGNEMIRSQLAAMSPGERREVNDAYGTFDKLPPGERRTLIELAHTLADPSRSELVEAAKVWHIMVQFADPVDRRSLLELDTRERMEWIDRRMRPWRGPIVNPGGPSSRPSPPQFRPGLAPPRTLPSPD